MSGSSDPDELRRALDLLGVGPGATRAEIRAAYRSAVMRTHPDLSAAADATVRTIGLRAAYELVVGVTGEQLPADDEPTWVALVDDDTVGVAAPPGETLALLVEAAHRLGDVGYLDPTAGLLEVIVEFADAPTSSMVLSLQGRATGVTEVFCTVEPLSGGDTPPVGAVTRLLVRTLRGEDPSV